MVPEGNHAIVASVPDDDEVRARLRELEAEVSAKTAADRQRKAEALARVQARRTAAAEESTALRRRQAELVTRRRDTDATEDSDAPVARKPRRETGDLDRALSLARKAGDVKEELARPTKAGEKSWLISAALSFFFGPLGWLYAGAFRETIPIAGLYVIAAAVISKIIPMFLLMPVMMVVLPISAIGGLVYAIGHNRAGHRIRLFGDDKAKDGRLGSLGKGELPPGDDD
jgi:hypothetical protein